MLLPHVITGYLVNATLGLAGFEWVLYVIAICCPNLVSLIGFLNQIVTRTWNQTPDSDWKYYSKEDIWYDITDSFPSYLYQSFLPFQLCILAQPKTETKKLHKAKTPSKSMKPSWSSAGNLPPWWFSLVVPNSHFSSIKILPSPRFNMHSIDLCQPTSSPNSLFLCRTFSNYIHHQKVWWILGERKNEREESCKSEWLNQIFLHGSKIRRSPVDN